MNDRLEIASRLLAGDAAGEGYWNSDDKACTWALKLADTLIKLEQETRPKEGKEEVLWMTEEPSQGSIVWILNEEWKTGDPNCYYDMRWHGSTEEIRWLERREVFESEDKIRKFLKLD